MRNARLATLTALGAAALALSGCAGATPGEGGGRISVVAVTDAYGSIAEAIGGDLVDVASIISGSAQDPHEYEATARDQLAVNRADLVIVNGGGYDDFLTRLLESSDAAVVNASEASGLLPADAEAHEHDEHDDHADGDAEDHAADDHDGHAHIAGFNEHVWYSIHGVAGIAEAIAAELTALAPDGADAIAQRADAFLAELDALHDRAHALEHELGGGDIMSTEPVAAHLLADLGFRDVTPTAFLSAVEAGTGISARTLDEVLDRLEADGIRLLAVNPQSAGSEAELVREAAEAAGVPVVEFAETLPEGLDFLGWVAANLDAVEAALR